MGIPEGINFEDTDADEKPIEGAALSIVYSGKILKPLQTRRGLVFIESRYLSPVSDVLEVLELYERITTGGTPYIVAKAGLLLQAVIMPFDVINYRLVELAASGTIDDPIPYPETTGIVVNVASGLYYSYKGGVYLAKADMPDCVYPPDTPTLWQWEKVEGR